MHKVREFFSKFNFTHTVILQLQLLLVLQATVLFTSCSATYLKCPLYQMHLQKIVGFRPPLEFLHARNLIYGPEHNFKTRNRHDTHSSSLDSPLPPTTTITTEYINSEYESDDWMNPPVSIRCWRICHTDNDCISYVHLLDTDECFGFTYFERAQDRFVLINGEMPLVTDSEAIYYEKTCLMIPNECRNRLWVLTKIPGTSLVFQGKKTIDTLVTRRDCSEKCLFEHEFKCLSASFAPSYRNNRERFSAHTAQPTELETLGRCILSDRDKMIQPDAFRAAPYDEEYIENQCHERPIENNNCSFELYVNSTFIYSEAKYGGLTQKECQTKCTHEKRFFCQGVSFYFSEDLRQSECLLHSEDIISMGPRSLKLQLNSVYMRRVKCLDVQVVCTKDEMVIKYTPRDYFIGKMYANMHSNECMVKGNGTRSTTLRLSIGEELKESRCGVLRAYEMTENYQRIFISTLIVLQNNPNVQTQGDRLIKVGCIISNTTTPKIETAENETITMNTDESTETADNVKETSENVPNAIALESSVEFAQRLPNEGTLLVNISDAELLPKIYLQIIDISHEHQTKDVLIGQNLELQIVAEYSPLILQQFPISELPPLHDFRATSLIAKTQDKANFVTLIDQNGCPTDPTVFPALERKREITKNVLSARFHAFKFAGSSMVNFDVKIRFCEHAQCPPSNCLPNASPAQMPETLSIMGRRRRQLSSVEQQQHYRIQNPVYISTVMDVVDRDAYVVNSSVDNARQSRLLNYTQSHNPNAMPHLNSVPLNYDLHVRGPDMAGAANSFIYGERGVLLIAGVDNQLHLDNICLNQSLIIAIFIFWLIFQVAILFSCAYFVQKYRRLSAIEEERRKFQENMDYLEARRVHWADQGGYTL